MLQVDNLHLTFNQGTAMANYVLRGLNLTINAGEFVTVIGTNGAGKSTLLNAVSGSVIAERGKILVGGTDVSKWSVSKRAKLIARVFQDPMAGTCEQLTIEENLALAFNRGKKRRLTTAITTSNRRYFADKLATLNLGLEHRLSDRMGLLSGGQRQAVSLLMASLTPSRLLLLDEHTAALDPKTAQFVLALTDRIIKDNGLTAMMVTHSMAQALTHGTRTVMLNAGQVVLDVAGDDRLGMTTHDLLALFEKSQGETLSDDSLLLG